MREEWPVGIATPSMRAAHMGVAKLHDMGMEFIRQVLSESQRMWLAHTKARDGPIKAGAGLRGSMVWALQELHQ